MSWWRFWESKSITARDADFWSRYEGVDNWAGEPVSPQGAMNLSAFWACSRLLSQTIATLPIGVYQRAANGDKIPVADHPLYALLHDSPNADQTAVEFWEGRMLGLTTQGNGYAEKVEGSGGRLISLERMPPNTAVERTQAGALQYKFSDRGKEIVLPEEKVLHLKGFGDGDKGLSVVSNARQTLGISTATEKAVGQVNSKGLRSKGFFVMPAGSKALTDQQRADAQQNLVKANSGPNAPWAGILEGGVVWAPTNISPKDAEMILNRRFNVEDICRWFGVPPILIGHATDGQTMWGSGVEQIMIGWLTLGLRPYLVRIEQRIKKSLLTPADRARGIFVEFNVEGLLRADSKARAEIFNLMVQGGALQPAEWRRKENLPFVEGSDKLFINQTLAPLNQVVAGGDFGSERGIAAFLDREYPHRTDNHQFAAKLWKDIQSDRQSEPGSLRH